MLYLLWLLPLLLNIGILLVLFKGPPKVKDDFVFLFGVSIVSLIPLLNWLVVLLLVIFMFDEVYKGS